MTFEESKRTLNLSEPIILKEVKEAYITILLKCHPNLFFSNILKFLSIKKLFKINEAYEYLIKNHFRTDSCNSLSDFRDRLKNPFSIQEEIFADWIRIFNFIRYPEYVSNIPLVGKIVELLFGFIILFLGFISFVHGFLVNITMDKKKIKQPTLKGQINASLSLKINIKVLFLYFLVLIILKNLMSPPSSDNSFEVLSFILLIVSINIVMILFECIAFFFLKLKSLNKNYILINEKINYYFGQEPVIDITKGL